MKRERSMAGRMRDMHGNTGRMITRSVARWSLALSVFAALLGCGSASTRLPTLTARPTTIPASTLPPTSTPWAPNGTILFNGPDALCAVDPDGSGKRALTAPGYSVVSFAVSPDGQQVAFCSEQAGEGIVYVMNVDGTGIVQLTPASESDCDPAWSPKGDRLALLRKTSADAQVIYTIAPDGSNLTPVAEAESFRWSPDGEHIALLTDRGSEQAAIRVVGADGSAEVTVFEGPLVLGWTYFSWSPDASHIVLNTLDAEISVVSADGVERVRIAKGEGPAWSPDGRRIALGQRQWGEGGEVLSWAIVTINADGTEQRELLGPERMPGNFLYCERPLWSPDGRHILVACIREDTGESSLWVVAADGSSLELIAEETGCTLGCGETGCILTWDWIDETLPATVTTLPLPTPQPTSPSLLTWVIETVDAPKDFKDMGDRSLRLDAAGHPHIAYGVGHLYHAWHDGTAWRSEMVDSAVEVGAYASLALDSAGYPRISYYDDLNDDLKYAYYNGSTWYIETVDSDGLVGEDTSLVLDSEEHPHISYLGRSDRNLKYAQFNGSAWQIETVDGEGEAGHGASLQLDPAGNPHISYGYIVEGAGHGQLRYAYHDGSRWHIETVDRDLVLALGYTSLALDEATLPHIAYYDMRTFELKYAYYDGGDWHVSIVDHGGQYGGDVSLVLDAAGHPCISYYDQHNDVLKYAHHEGSDWRIDAVENDLGFWAGNTSLALDDAGQPHISYSTYDEYSGGGIDLRYAQYDGSAWQIEVVDKGGDLRGSTSLALDSAGRPHIGYVESLGHDLKYAHYDGATWQPEIVVSEASVGSDISLALDANDLPHISYFSFTSVVRGLAHSDLMYTHYDGNTWQVEIVDREGDVGYDNSIAVDSAGRPHISYFDQGHNNLKHAYFDGTIWQIETVGESGMGGWYTSLAMNAEDHPRISYYDQRSDHLKYASHDGSAWRIRTVDDMKGAGWCSSLALDAAGYPHIGYIDRESYALKYAYYDGVDWTIQWIGAEGRSVALVLDHAGRPHISCYNSMGYSLVYIYNDGSSWHYQAVDSLGSPGDYSSLVVDEAGLVHISYYDWTTGGLRYAHQVVEGSP